MGTWRETEKASEQTEHSLESPGDEKREALAYVTETWLLMKHAAHRLEITPWDQKRRHQKARQTSACLSRSLPLWPSTPQLGDWSPVYPKRSGPWGISGLLAAGGCLRGCDSPGGLSCCRSPSALCRSHGEEQHQNVLLAHIPLVSDKIWLIWKWKKEHCCPAKISPRSFHHFLSSLE